MCVCSPHERALVFREGVRGTKKIFARGPITMMLRYCLGVILSCTPFTAVARSCRFALYNICSIRSFVTKERNTTCHPSTGHPPPGQLQLCLGCSPSRCAKFSIYLNSAHVTPSSVTSTGFLLQPASNSRRWYLLSRPSTEWHPSTLKLWSDHTPQHEHLAPLHQLAGWYCHC